MACTSPCPPKYRHYKPKDLAVVRIGGHDHYLGKFGSPESHERYARLVAEWQATGEQSAIDRVSDKSLLVVALILRYLCHTDSYYVKDGKPTVSR